MKNSNRIVQYIVALALSYFGVIKLMASVSIFVLIDMLSSGSLIMLLLPYFAVIILGVFEILLGLSLFIKNLNQYVIHLLLAYIPILILTLVFGNDFNLTQSPFLLGLNLNAILAQSSLVLIIFIILRSKSLQVKS